MDIIVNKNTIERYVALSTQEKQVLKEKMLKSCNNQSDNDLFQCLLAKIFSIDELEKSLDEKEKERATDLKSALEAYYRDLKKSQLEEEKQKLTEIEKTTYHSDKRRKAEQFLSDYPNGNLTEKVKQILEDIENELWQNVRTANEYQLAQELDNYLYEYPNGRYKDEALTLKEDLPWAIVKINPTLAKLDDYSRKYPNKHIDEIQQLRKKIQEDIEDDNDWAKVKGNKEEAIKYKQKHPRGKYVKEADEIINRPLSPVDEIIQNLKIDRNHYKASRIKKELDNYQLSEKDLVDIFSLDEINAIKNFQMVEQLPDTPPQDTLKRDYTEVYFWGTKGTGKTCALGAVLSEARKEKISNLLIHECAGGDYMTGLSNLFEDENICTLPESTSTKSIPEMTLELKDSDKFPHKIMFIDFAGEVFQAIYKYMSGKKLKEDEKNSLDRIQKYLKNDYNNKIHFFVVEYGEDKSQELVDAMELPRVRQIDVLQAMANYLKKEDIFTTSTVGVYCLVTKCDRMDCSIEERPKKACEYVINNYGAFWDQVIDECESAQIAECETISFSIGDVFAQTLCRFKPDDTIKILRKLLSKTAAQKDGFFGKLHN